MTLTLPLPFALEQTLRPERARLHLAIGAFAAEEVTLGQAADIAGVSQTELMGELSRRRIPLHYDRGEFAEDLQTLTTLRGKVKHGGHQ
jgi:predicted HTH domain antitoxin